MDQLTDIAIHKTTPLVWLKKIAQHTTDSQTNLSLEYGFDSDASDEVEPDDVKSLQHQQQPIEQPPGLVRPDDLPALKQNTVNNPATNMHNHTEFTGALDILIWQLLVH